MKRAILLPALLGLIPASGSPAANPVFEAQTVDDRISIGYGLAIADMDGDGRNDIVLADAREIVWYRNPGWSKHVIARNLTKRDNVCVAARDIDGDGKAEVAVGAQWNPGETSNDAESGAVFWLQRPPADTAADGLWTPVALPHEPTVHRMHWVRTAAGRYALVVLPLHGRGNSGGSGEAVRMTIAFPPENPVDAAAWTIRRMDTAMHITHNFDVRDAGDAEEFVVGGKEGLVRVIPRDDWAMTRLEIRESGGPPFPGAGEIRYFPAAADAVPDLCTIEPFHGSDLVHYAIDRVSGTAVRKVIDRSFRQGHAIACADMTGSGSPQIVAGWREPNADGEFGIRLYRREGDDWKHTWIAGGNSMACEDLKVADLNGDGKPDVIAAGRSTHNVVIYWNRN